MDSTSADIFNRPLDALPYYDRDLDAPNQQHLRPAINSLIAVELRNLLPKTPTAQPDNLTHLAQPRALPATGLLANELTRVQSKKPVPTKDVLDTTRYSVPPPTGKDANKVEAWERAHQSSLAQLEQQRLRSINADLLSKHYGSNAWKVQNFSLENTTARIEREGDQVKSTVEDINRRRKADQDKGGEILSRLENKWTELVSDNMQLEIGCMALEAEVAQLQARHSELQSRLQAA